MCGCCINMHVCACLFVYLLMYVCILVRPNVNDLYLALLLSSLFIKARFLLTGIETNQFLLL